MTQRRIKELLRELDSELRRTEDLDEDTRARLETLGRRLETEEPVDDSLSEQALEIEARFAANHPTAARIARQIADMLSNMGI
jgi:type IV pilus biogenesis protein CpaD/CtpE